MRGILLVILLPVPNVLAQPGRVEPVNLLINGSFESGPDPGGFITLSTGSEAIQGWIVTRGTIDYIGSYWPSSQGNRNIDLDGTPGAGGIQQTFATIPGGKYLVSFDLSGNSQGPPAVKKLRVTVAGEEHEFSFDTNGKGPGTDWVRQSVSFTAIASRTTLEFVSLDSADNLCGPVLDNVAITPVSRQSAAEVVISGTWMDNHAAQHFVEQSGARLLWRTQTHSLTGQAALYSYSGTLRGREFEIMLDQQSRQLMVSQEQRAPARVVGIISLDGQTIELTTHFGEAAPSMAESKLVRVADSSGRKPASLLIFPEKPSTLAGQPIEVQVLIKDSKGRVLKAARDYRLNVVARGGEVSDPRPTIHAEEVSARFRVTRPEEGESVLQVTSEPPLGSASRSVFYCGAGAISAIELSSGENRGKSDPNTPLSFTLKLTDGMGHLRADKEANTITLKRAGVGAVDRDSVVLPIGECLSERSIESGTPGSATVTVTHGRDQSDKGDFIFYLELSVSLFLLIAAGGLGGVLIRTTVEWSQRRRWSARRVSMDGAAGVLAGTSVFLAYYYGLLRLAPMLTAGSGIGFLLGLVGGYLGPAAMNHISSIVLPNSGGPGRKQPS